MPRCHPTAKALPALAVVALAWPLCALALTPLSQPASAPVSAPASAPASAPVPVAPPVATDVLVPLQLGRQLPRHSLRGEIEFTQPPAVMLNGQPARLAPGSRIRGQNNLLVMWGNAVGQKATVNYTLDGYGLLMDVWVLRPDEMARRWPKTAQEAASWTYDPVTATWSK